MIINSNVFKSKNKIILSSIKRKTSDVLAVQFDILIQSADNLLSIEIRFVVIQNALLKDEVHLD